MELVSRQRKVLESSCFIMSFFNKLWAQSAGKAFFVVTLNDIFRLLLFSNFFFFSFIVLAFELLAL